MTPTHPPSKKTPDDPGHSDATVGLHEGKDPNRHVAQCRCGVCEHLRRTHDQEHVPLKYALGNHNISSLGPKASATGVSLTQEPPAGPNVPEAAPSPVRKAPHGGEFVQEHPADCKCGRCEELHCTDVNAEEPARLRVAPLDAPPAGTVPIKPSGWQDDPVKLHGVAGTAQDRMDQEAHIKAAELEEDRQCQEDLATLDGLLGLIFTRDPRARYLLYSLAEKLLNLRR